MVPKGGLDPPWVMAWAWIAGAGQDSGNRLVRYLLNLAAIVATCRPWNRAAARSFSDGVRSPRVPAIVEAP